MSQIVLLFFSFFENKKIKFVKHDFFHSGWQVFKKFQKHLEQEIMV